VIIIDFETFFDSEFTLKKMSTINHIMDPRFEVLGMSTYNIEDDGPKFYDPDMVSTILGCWKRHYGENFENVTVVAHNAKYDAAILKWIYGITPKYIVDTMGMAMHWDARAPAGLEELAQRENLPPKGDTKEFKSGPIDADTRSGAAAAR
jgi:DNA polymerase